MMQEIRFRFPGIETTRQRSKGKVYYENDIVTINYNETIRFGLVLSVSVDTFQVGILEIKNFDEHTACPLLDGSNVVDVIEVSKEKIIAKALKVDDCINIYAVHHAK